MSTFAGHKVIVLTFDATNPDKAMLSMADSVQKADTSVFIVGVPAADFTGYSSDTALSSMHDSLALSFPFTKVALVTRASGNVQEALFKWLTDVTLNQHFDRDVDAPGQMYLISERGVLYGILTKDATPADIFGALNQSINQ